MNEVAAKHHSTTKGEKKKGYIKDTGGKLLTEGSSLSQGFKPMGWWVVRGERVQVPQTSR